MEQEDRECLASTSQKCVSRCISDKSNRAIALTSSSPSEEFRLSNVNNHRLKGGGGKNITIREG